jgi:hypothetical protein
MAQHDDYAFCFSSDCGYCRGCVSGKECPYKNPLDIFTEATGEVFVHPPVQKSPWERYRGAMKSVEEAREWLDARKEKESQKPVDSYYDRGDRYENAGYPLDRAHPDYDQEWAEIMISRTLLNYSSLVHGLQPDFVIAVEPFQGKTIGELMAAYDDIVDVKLIEKYEGKFTEAGKLYKPDFEVSIEEIVEARQAGVRIEGQIQVSTELGLYNADIQNKIDALGNEEFEKYFEMFEKYQGEICQFLKEMNFEPAFQGEPIKGDLPKEVKTDNGTYTLLETIGGQMCDEPTCCAMGHCMVNLDRYTGDKPPPGDSYEYSSFFQLLPVYTKAHKHELCALCLLKNNNHS